MFVLLIIGCVSVGLLIYSCIKYYCCNHLDYDETSSVPDLVDIDDFKQQLINNNC